MAKDNLDSVRHILRDLTEIAKQDGYAEGYEEGYAEGYNDGYGDGREDEWKEANG